MGVEPQANKVMQKIKMGIRNRITLVKAFCGCSLLFEKKINTKNMKSTIVIN